MIVPPGDADIMSLGANSVDVHPPAPHDARRAAEIKMRRLMMSGAIALTIGACATTPGATCPAGADDRLVAELFFGRNIGDALGVSEPAFRRFVDVEVTPRFPDGFTIYDARGQYRDGERKQIVREPSKVLMIVLADETRDAPRLREIAETYKTQFRQQSVAIVTRRSCASF